MLVLSGRCVGLNSDTYTNKNDRVVHTHRLSIATDTGILTVLVPDEKLGTLDVLALRTFGTTVEILCEPALDYDFGKPKPALRVLDLNVVATEHGEVLNTAPAHA